MQLKSLEICGFKSFPDRIQLQFDSGITAVVGPNGSGKSNIADAVRWVLGEQSGKTLRSGKMEDVIFTGTQQRKAMGYAWVSMVIDNAAGVLPAESEEVAIGRKLYRSGESEYRINGAAVRLRDVNELFMDTGLGRDGYSIIGQGRIAEIVGAKSAQRREIFEEAAGISKYRYRKEQAEKKLEAAQENLARLWDILTELESRVEPLRVQSHKAQEYVRYAERKRTLEISLWLLAIERSRDLLRVQEDRLILVQSDHEALENELREIEQNVLAVYEGVAQRNVEIEKRRAQAQELRDQTARAGERKAVWSNDIRHNEETAARLHETIAVLTASREQIEERLARSARQLLEKETESGRLAQREGELRSRLLARERERSAALEKQQALSQERTALARRTADERLKMATSSTMLEQLQMQAQGLEAQERRSLEAMEDHRKQLGDVEALLASIEAETAAQAHVLQGYQYKRGAVQEDITQLETARAELLSAQKGREQKAKLVEDMEKNMEGYQQSVKFIMNQQRSGNLRGIEGPVSRLISVEDRCFAAIEAALAGAMQNIVVTTDTAAKVAIQALKSARAGRATFLPISVIKPRALDEQGLAECEGFVAVACDLVKTREQYVPIVQNLLGRIAVARDMDCALVIARKYGRRFKIVTLDGQVINPGGSMTGGSLAQGAGLLSRAGEIGRLRREAEEAGEQAQEKALAIKKYGEERSMLEARLSGIEADLRTMSEDKIRYEGERKRLSMALAELERQRDEGERQAREVGRRREQLLDQSGSSDGILRELVRMEDACGASIEELHKALEEAVRLIAGQNAEISSLNMEKLALDKDADTIRQLASQLESQLHTQRGETAELTARIECLRRQNDDTLRSIAEEEESLRRMETACAEHIAAIQRLEEEKTALEADTTRQRQRERELHGRAELLARDLAKLEERRTTIQREYDAVVARLFDEYELTQTQAVQMKIPLEDISEANRELAVIKGKIKELGSINLEAIEEFREVNERYQFMKAQIEDAENSKEQLRRLILDLTQQMRELFSDSFQEINDHFGRIFSELFGGGNAKLLLDDPDNVLDSGIEIYVQPPGKIIRNLASLSGGEQAFVAIAIYFAILKVRPSPFCLLDEIEAALDDVNVVKFARYLRRLSDKTQFIAITHRRGTMEEADVLYGVTMQEEGVSKLLRLGVSELESKLGPL